MTVQHYDPTQHEAQLVAAFERRQAAVAARDALLGAGLPAHAMEIIPAEAAEPAQVEGLWTSFRRLFAPDDEAQQLGEAIERGHVMVIVRPETPKERETAIEVLEGSGPLDLEEHGWPTPPELAAGVPDRPEVRIVEERLRVGWRDRSLRPTRVRGYVAAREPRTQRVELLEEDITPPPARPGA